MFIDVYCLTHIHFFTSLQKGIFVALLPFCLACLMVLIMFTLIVLIYPEIVMEATDDSTTTSHADNSEAFFRDVQHNKNNVEGLDTCSNNDPLGCFKVVVEKFVLGEWDSDSHLVNIVYGFILLLILTNVVIAIISDVWAQSADTASSLFWRSRLTFLSELTVLDKVGKSKFWTKFHLLLEKIDRVKIPKVVDRISWSNTAPYSFVTKQKGEPQVVEKELASLDYFILVA